MLKSELTETDKHSIKILLRRKNIRFLSRTNLIKTRWQIFVRLGFLRKIEITSTDETSTKCSNSSFLFGMLKSRSLIWFCHLNLKGSLEYPWYLFFKVVYLKWFLIGNKFKNWTQKDNNINKMEKAVLKVWSFGSCLI